MSEPTSTVAVPPTVAEPTRTNGKDKESTQSQESTPATQPKKSANADTKASNGENNASNNTNTPPTSSATPTSTSAQSPKSQKPRKNNFTPRGGGSPASPSTRASDNGKKSARPDSASASEAGAVGLGVVAGVGLDIPTGSNSDKGAEPQQKPPQRTSGYTSRRGRPSDSQNSLSSITSPASTSEARFANARGGGYSSRGRDDDNFRGRRFDSRQNRGAPDERVSTPKAGAESDPSVPADTRRPLQQSHSTGSSDVRKSSGYSTRSPLSPRSPRRGFGERGMESRRNTNAVAQEGSAASSPQTETGSSNSAAPQNKRKANRKNKKPEDDDGSVTSVGSAKGSENAMDGRDSTRSEGARDYRTNQQQQPRDWKNDAIASGKQRNDVRRDAAATGAAAEWASSAVKSTDKKDTAEAPSGWGDAPAATSTQQTDGWGSSANVSLKWGEELPWEKSDKKDSPVTKPLASPKPKVGKAAERKNGDDSQKGWGNSPVEPTTSNQGSGWGEPPNTNVEWGKEEHLGKDAKKGFAATKHAAATKPPKTTRAPAARNNNTTGSGWGDAPTASSKTGDTGGWSQPENTNSTWGEEATRDNSNARKAVPPARAQPTSAPRNFNRKDRKDDNSTQGGWGAAPEAASSAAPADGWGAPIVTNKKWGEDLPWENDSSSSNAVSDTAPSTASKTPSKPERKENSSVQDGWNDGQVKDLTAQSSGGWGEPVAVAKKWGEDLPWETGSGKDTPDNGSAPNKAAVKKGTSAANGWGDAPATDSKSNQADGWGQPVVTTSTWGDSVPWEQPSSNKQDRKQERDGGDFPRRNSSQDMRDSRTNNNRQGYGGFQERSGYGQGRPPGRGGDARFEDSRQHGYQRDRKQDERPTRRFQEGDSASRSQDARSSLDARNERLGFHRAPRRPDSLQETNAPTEQTSSGGWERSKPIAESSWDSSKTATSPNQRRGFSPAGSGDGRFDARYGNSRPGYGRSENAPPHRGQRNEGYSSHYGQNNQSSNARSSEKPSRDSFSKDKADAVSQGPKGKNAKEARAAKPPGQTPALMFSDSLECQMTWEEMDLRPNVLESIAKASLPKPSNIQKLIMKPFKEGRDVIAQSQSQKDRTNTLAIALLQKLTPIALTQKHCKAVMICSEGINPQQVHEDIQGWFESTPGLSSILLSSDSNAEKQKSILSDPEQAKQVVITTLGPLMDVLRNGLLDMKQVHTVVVSMREKELVKYDAFKQVWAILPREAQVILMTGSIQPQIQLIKTQNFRADAAVRRADELTMQWSEHYYVNIPSQRQDHEELGGEKGQDRDQSKDENEDQSENDDQAVTATPTRDEKWEVLMEILGKNPDISHIVILTQSQSSTQSLTTKLEEHNQPVLSVWSMADKTDVARQFNRPERCILVSESILMENLDLDHSSLVINYEMPKRPWHYISSFGPFGRSGLRTLMINFCVSDDPAQKQTLETMESLFDIKIQEMKV